MTHTHETLMTEMARLRVELRTLAIDSPAYSPVSTALFNAVDAVDLAIKLAR